MNKNQKGNSNIVIISLVSLLVLASVAAMYFYMQTKMMPNTNQNLVKYPIQVSNQDSKVVVPSSEMSAQIMPPIANPGAIDQNLPKVVEDKSSAVVVFTPMGIFTDQEINELNKKLIEPMLQWNKDNNFETVSINVQKNATPVAGYTYGVDYIYSNGGNGGFLFGSKSPLEWWYPECMGGCKFSPEFKQKFPEIIKFYTN